MWLDPDGDPIPVDYIDPNVRARSVMVNRLFDRALEIEETLADFHDQCARKLATIYPILPVILDYPGKRRTPNSCHSINIVLSRLLLKRIIFDEFLQLAKQKIDQCITRWAQGIG